MIQRGQEAGHCGQEQELGVALYKALQSGRISSKPIYSLHHSIQDFGFLESPADLPGSHTPPQLGKDSIPLAFHPWETGSFSKGKLE